MRLHDALRDARGPGRVDDVELVIHAVVDGRVLRRTGIQPGGEALPAVRLEADRNSLVVFDPADASVGVLDEAPERRRHEQHARVGIVDEPGDLIRREQTADRDHAGPRLADAVHDDEHLERVAHQHGYLVALADAGGNQGIGYLIQPIVELAPTEPFAAAHDRRLSGFVLGVACPYARQVQFGVIQVQHHNAPSEVGDRLDSF